MSKATTRSPFPWLPMMAICIGLVSNAYAMTNLFPYIGYMVQYLGVTDDKDEAGFYAGYVSSAVMVGRLGTSYLWGCFTDRYGRLPVMYISLLSMVVLSIAFGMSTSFYWAMACRFFLGAMNGLVATSKTMISEVCPKEHEVVGMSTITACMSFGLIVGPAIGGFLSEPAKKYSIFSEFGLFGRFPYLLPNLVGACIALAGLIMVFLFLPETEPTRARNGSGDSNGLKPLSTPERDTTDPVCANKSPAVAITYLSQETSLNCSRESHDTNLVPGAKTSSTSTRAIFVDDTDGIRTAGNRTRPLKKEDIILDDSGSERCRLYHTEKGYDTLNEEVDEERGYVRNACWTGYLVPMTLLSKPRVLGLLFVYGLFSFIKIGFNDVYPLWTMSTIASGGLDWTTNEIGKSLSIAGLALLVFQMTIYSPLVKATGIQGSQRVSSLVMVPMFMAMPLLSLLHDKGWVLIAANLVILFFINIAANTIFINLALAINNAVDPSSRGTINGISMTTASLTRAAGPTFFAVVFAWSINLPRPFPFNYHMTFYVMAVLMAVVSLAGWDVIRIPDTDESPIDEDCITTEADKEAGIDETSDRA